MLVCSRHHVFATATQRPLASAHRPRFVAVRAQTPNGGRGLASRAPCFVASRLGLRVSHPSLLVCNADSATAETEASPTPEKKETPLTYADLAIGETYKGVVRGVAKFGIFVDFGAETQAMIHISELTDSFVEDTSEVASVGDKVEFRLIALDQERARISGSIRQVANIPDDSEGKTPTYTKVDPRQRTERRGPRRPRSNEPIPYKPGDEVSGTVDAVLVWGAFVTLPKGRGLLHISELNDVKESGSAELPSAADFVSEGDDLTLRVLSVENGKISLTQKSAEEIEEERKFAKGGMSAGPEELPESTFSMLFKNAGIKPAMFDAMPEGASLSYDEEDAGEVAAETPAVAEAEPVAVPEPVVEAVPEPEPVAEPVAEAEPEPVAEPVPEPVAEPVAEAEPEPVVEPVPEPVAEPVAEAEPEPVVEPVPEPVAEPVAEAEPEPVVEPVPEPVAEPVAEAEPEPVVEAAPEAEPVAEPVAEAEPESVVEPVPEPVVEPVAEAAEPVAETTEPTPTPASGTAITAKLVKQLRDITGVGMMDCKKALTEANGDIAVAEADLKKKGKMTAAKKAGRIAAEGAIGTYIHTGSRLGVMVELNCETDFVARGDLFKQLLEDIAMQIAASTDVVCVSVDDFPAEVLENEKRIELAKEDLQSKPEAIREKMVTGRLEKMKKTAALLEQPFVKDQDKTVQDVITDAISTIGENISIRRFERYNLGEGLEKRSDDFASEVAEQTKKKEEKPAEPEKEEEAPKAEAPAEEEVPAIKVSAADVKSLRTKTGAGMMDCKKALQQCGGNIGEAEEFLKVKGMAGADKKAGRIAAEGLIGAYIHTGAQLGIMIEVNCETDFVAKNEVFKELVEDMAMQIAACPDVQFVTSEDISQEVLDKEREVELAKEDLQSKPENVREMMVNGRLEKYKKTLSLLEQDFVKDSTKTVEQVIKEAVATLGENIKVRRFTRYNLGEGLEKRNDDFAAEVAAQTGGL
ncbi:hypothetical protein BSKO_07383 [Bryopsis sp. KO-2023]|nr:hypothetical protein BSKO_07383 [Bryopsis sp. KO-2023]